MKRSQALLICLVCPTLLMGWLCPGVASEPPVTLVRVFEGHIKAIKVDTCGLTPGTCQLAMVLVKREGGEISFAIRPETGIKHNEQLVTIDDLRVGDLVKVQAIQLAGEYSLPIVMLEVMTP
jgi:hypothetical protein